MSGAPRRTSASSFRKLLIAAVLGGMGVTVPGPSLAKDAQTLMLDNKCYVCHENDYPKAGPAFADIAAAYRGDRRAVERVAGVIRRGQHGSSPWPMPPHPELTRAEARTIARYILAMRAEAAARR